jgi:hypothetical protein
MLRSGAKFTRPLVAITVIALALAGCGSEGPTDETGSSESATSSSKALSDASDVEVSAYRDLEPRFWERFLYQSNVEADQNGGRERIFRGGVTACIALTTTGLSVQEIVANVETENGITHDGAESIAAAATEVLCPETGYRLATRTTHEADQMAGRLTAELAGAQIDEEAAERNAKLICSFLEHNNGDPTGLTDYIFSEMIPFTSVPIGLNEVKALVRISVAVRCFPLEPRLGPYWSGA